MSEVKGAARRTDLIEHGRLKALAVRKITTALYQYGKVAYDIYRVAKVGAAVGGPATWVGLGVSFVVEYAVGKAVDKAWEWYAERIRQGIPGIATGSPTVFVNGLNGARGGGVDTTFCHNTVVMQGSEWVSYDGKPASRLDDLTKCPGDICTSSQNVLIGGPPTEYDPHKTLDNVLFVIKVMTAMKGDMGKAAVKGATGGEVARAGLNAGAKVIEDKVKSEVKKTIWDDNVKPWAKDQGVWPW